MTAVAQRLPIGTLNTLSTMTGAVTGYALNAAGFAGGLAAGFVDGFVVGFKDGFSIMSPRTPSAIEQDRFQKPMSALLDAALEHVELAVNAADHVMPSGQTYLEAIRLLRMLPSSVGAPEPVVEPSGAIAWMWDRNDGDFLVLAVSGKGRLQRSAVIEGQEYYGTTALSDRLTASEIALLSHFRSSHA